jgi:hypothetical protein
MKSAPLCPTRTRPKRARAGTAGSIRSPAQQQRQHCRTQTVMRLGVSMGSPAAAQCCKQTLLGSKHTHQAGSCWFAMRKAHTAGCFADTPCKLGGTPKTALLAAQACVLLVTPPAELPKTHHQPLNGIHVCRPFALPVRKRATGVTHSLHLLLTAFILQRHAAQATRLLMSTAHTRRQSRQLKACCQCMPSCCRCC